MTCSRAIVHRTCVAPKVSPARAMLSAQSPVYVAATLLNRTLLLVP